MGVRKFRTVEQMESHDWVAPGDPNLGRYISEVWTFAAKITPCHPPRGVRKHRNIEALNRYHLPWKGS